MLQNESLDGASPKPFGLWDAVSIIIGIVVGTAIFKSPTMVFQSVDSPTTGLVLWGVGGVLSLLGAFCYAELATTYPRVGGDFEYLTRGFGRPVGFLFGWSQLTVVLTASIASMSYAFADYGGALWNLSESGKLLLAVSSIVILTALNLIGSQAGRRTQNLLTCAKILGLSGLIAAGVFLQNTESVSRPANINPGGSNPGLALVFILYAFGGWNDSAFVAAEIRGARRNIPMALITSLAAITLLYLAINIVYLHVLGFEGLRESGTPASDVLKTVGGKWGSRGISLLVMISCLGAINGTILTGSRVYAVLGSDHRILGWLGRWNSRRSTPVTALVAQAGVSILMVLMVGTYSGQRMIDGGLRLCGFDAVPWNTYFGGFETMVAASAPVFWFFFLLTGLVLLVLRRRDPERERPFRVPLYPLPVLAFCTVCGWMLYSSIEYAGVLSLFGLLPIVTGLPIYLFGQRQHQADQPNSS